MMDDDVRWCSETWPAGANENTFDKATRVSDGPQGSAVGTAPNYNDSKPPETGSDRPHNACRGCKTVFLYMNSIPLWSSENPLLIGSPTHVSGPNDPANSKALPRLPIKS
ncbi:unnamed protein product [Lota lota]